MRLIYVAGKFTAKTPEEIEQNILAAEEVARELISRSEEFAVLVPHSLGRNFVAGPGSPEYWYTATLTMALRCDAMLMVSNWRDSSGSRGELRAFAALNKPAFFSVNELIAAHDRGEI